MESIRIVVADDHTLFRAGLKRLLTREKDLLVTGEAERAEDTEPAVARGKADVLLLDLKMPGGEAVQTLLDLEERRPRTRTVILTAFDHEDSILDTEDGSFMAFLRSRCGLGVDFSIALCT